MAKRKKKSHSESPTCSCLLLCDDVLRSAKDKHFLNGIIGSISVHTLPAVIGNFVAYVRLSNVYAKQKVTIAFECAANGESIFSLEGETGATSDPLGVYTLVIPIPMFRIEDEGRYVFVASHGGMPFAQSPVQIKLIKPPTEEIEP